MTTLAEEFPKEQARLRELIETYRAIGMAGDFGRVMIELTLQQADKAAAEQDLPKMLWWFRKMKECQ